MHRVSPNISHVRREKTTATHFGTNPSPATNSRTRHATKLRTINFAKSAAFVSAVDAAAAAGVVAAEEVEAVPMGLRWQIFSHALGAL